LVRPFGHSCTLHHSVISKIAGYRQVNTCRLLPIKK